MLFSDALEVAIGLTFVYLLVSLVMTAVVEAIETITKTRGRSLYNGIAELVGDPERAETGSAAAHSIYSHPLVQGLFRGNIKSAQAHKQLPSYVPARNFALALIDQALSAKINAGETAEASVPQSASFSERLGLAAERIDNEPLRRAILQAVAIGGDDVDRVRQHLEGWYDSAMDRVSGAFKRRSQRLLFCLGLAGAVVLNINTLTIAESLSKNATLRRAVVAEAAAYNPGAEGETAGRTQERIDQLGLPLGWSRGARAALLHPVESNSGRPWEILGYVQIALGYLLTALAIMLGSPFWFDVLNRLMVIRATVKPHEKSKEEGSEDRASRSDQRTLTVVTETPESLSSIRAAGNATIDTDIYAEVPQSADRLFEDEEEEKGAAAGSERQQ